MPTTIKITVSPTDISVDRDFVQINNNTSVDWVCDAGTPFSIVFPGGGGSLKSSAAAGGKYVVSSDAFSNTTGKPKKVKYDVKSGSLHLDPDLEIQP